MFTNLSIEITLMEQTGVIVEIDETWCALLPFSIYIGKRLSTPSASTY